MSENYFDVDLTSRRDALFDRREHLLLIRHQLREQVVAVFGVRRAIRVVDEELSLFGYRRFLAKTAEGFVHHVRLREVGLLRYGVDELLQVFVDALLEWGSITH